MSLKRRQRVLITCMDRRPMITRSIVSKCDIDKVRTIVYETNEVSVLSYRMKKEGGPATIYEEFMKANEYAFEPHMLDKYDINNFDAMMNALNNIITEEQSKNSEIFINISSGTGEFCAAACLMGMMNDGIQVISSYNMDRRKKVKVEDEFGEEKYKLKNFNLIEIEKYKIPKPNMKLLKGLQIFSRLKIGDRSNTKVIRELINEYVWFDIRGEPHPEKGYGDTTNSEEKDGKKPKKPSANYEKWDMSQKNYYKKNILGKWIELGWIEEMEDWKGKYDLTKEGRRLLKIFFEPETEENKMVMRPREEYEAEREKINKEREEQMRIYEEQERNKNKKPSGEKTDENKIENKIESESKQ